MSIKLPDDIGRRCIRWPVNGRTKPASLGNIALSEWCDVYHK